MTGDPLPSQSRLTLQTLSTQSVNTGTKRVSTAVSVSITTEGTVELETGGGCETLTYSKILRLTCTVATA